MPHSSPLKYQSGFGNEFATEAHPGALPIGQNSPQKHPLGLYTEQVSGSAFAAPRGLNRRSWMYRIRPSVVHEPYQPFAETTLLRSGPFDEEPTPPNQMRWDPIPFPTVPTDFVE
ncbi:MAG: homogentisate 1,2-dioxygenase, partial [Acidobacteriaceae bacterium]